ncbi:MAG TPA: MBL fold metallo-hydrolase [Pyrinomonadaceae bacterium]|nr:MBL fold metallo-hydrolase [Pyrinomonadaceae bacterium]
MKYIAQVSALLCFLVVAACGQVKTAGKLPDDELSKPVAVKSGTSVTIRYIANEGVLIASADKQVLIDGLHREYKPAYLFPPPEMQAVLENAHTPYDKINLVLVSHMHLDHFHPVSIGQYVKSNSRAMFASSQQVVDDVAKNFPDYEKIRSRIKPVTHEWKKSSEINQDGIKVTFLGLRHSGERFKDIQNLGHVIEIGGKKFLHIGDADMTVENFSSFGIAAKGIDVALIPYWFLMSKEGRAFVKEQFNPKAIIAVHIPPADAAEVIAQLKTDLPEAVAFTKQLEERSY